VQGSQSLCHVYVHTLVRVFSALILLLLFVQRLYVRGYIQKFSDLPPGARTANGTVFCHQVQLYGCFVSQSSEFCFSTSVYCCKRIFHYGYTLVHARTVSPGIAQQMMPTLHTYGTLDT
jgi:hypothetical protein